MQIISTAPPKPSRNRVRMNMGKEVEKAPTITAQVSRQDRDTVHLGPSFTRIQAATKLPKILAAEMALFTEEGMVFTPNSWAMSVVTMEPHHPGGAEKGIGQEKNDLNGNGPLGANDFRWQRNASFFPFVWSKGEGMGSLYPQIYHSSREKMAFFWAKWRESLRGWGWRKKEGRPSFHRGRNPLQYKVSLRCPCCRAAHRAPRPGKRRENRGQLPPDLML